ncbi:hypothetical protein [Streptomyces sp. NPDC056672]|uniref:hypothetical protein n=1 Tax=Streptomyces sp. NPDC056672 TaxID=3345906 RepID=UPI0036A69B60
MALSRTRNAARHLDVEPARLTEAVCAFVGESAPTELLARRLITETFTVLDSVPLRTIAVHDLARTADDWPALPLTLPPTPWQAATLVDALAGLLRSLSPAELRTAAAGFALRRADLFLALLAEDHETARAVSSDDPFGMVDEETSAGRLSPESEQALLDALHATRPEQWTKGQCTAVRKTLLEHLARLGDGLLRVTEFVPAPLEWSPDGARRHTAAVPVPRSPNRLEARLRPEPLRGPLVPGSDAPLWPGPPPVPRDPWRWEIGWTLPDGDFIAETGTVEKTYAAAVFAAEQTIVEYLAAAPAVRQRWTGRLLIPRSPDELSADDPALRVLTLRDVLWAVAREDFEAETSVTDLLVSLYDTLRVPYPRPGEAAEGGRIGEPPFDAFVASHAVVLTPPARAYLQGISETSLDGSSVHDHHATGLRRALAPSSAEESQRLVTDLGPLPGGQAWSDLSGPAGLDRFLASDPQ